MQDGKAIVVTSAQMTALTTSALMEQLVWTATDGTRASVSKDSQVSQYILNQSKKS